MVRSNTAIKYVIFLALAFCLVLVPYVLAAGTNLIVEGMNVTLNKTENFDPVNASSFLNYTINVTITNLSKTGISIINMTLTENYSQDVIFNSSQPEPLAGTNNTFFLGNISDNRTIQVNITVMVRNITHGSVINNTVNISFLNANGNQYNLTLTENTTVNNPPLLNFTNISITKTDSPDPVTASTNLTYQINVSNTGNGTAYNVTVNDSYPPPAFLTYLTAVPAPVTGTNNAWYFNLTWGQNISINITVLVLNITNGTVINNSVNVTWQNETSGLLSRIANQSTTISNPPAYNTSTITMTKTATPSPVGINTQLNYTITVTASGNGTSFNVTVNDTYPSQLIFDSAVPAPISGTNNCWNFSRINATSILINITMNVTSLSDGTVLTNSVNATYQNETSGNLSAIASSSTTVSNPPGPQPGGSNGGGGGGGSGGYRVNRTNTTTKACFESWTCGDWSACENSQQSRECIDLRACKTTLLKPKLSQSCNPAAPKPAEPEPQPAAEPAPVEERQGILSVQGESPMPKLEKVFYGLAILALIGLVVYLGIMHKRSKR